MYGEEGREGGPTLPSTAATRRGWRDSALPHLKCGHAGIRAGHPGHGREAHRSRGDPREGPGRRPESQLPPSHRPLLPSKLS